MAPGARVATRVRHADGGAIAERWRTAALYPHQLSGGMCQRVLIAMAFSSNPRLVVADEPTTALDVTMHPPILRAISDTQRAHGTAVIFITHDLRPAAQLCDQVIVMYAGRALKAVRRAPCSWPCLRTLHAVPATRRSVGGR